MSFWKRLLGTEGKTAEKPTLDLVPSTPRKIESKNSLQKRIEELNKKIQQIEDAKEEFQRKISDAAEIVPSSDDFSGVMLTILMLWTQLRSYFGKILDKTNTQELTIAEMEDVLGKQDQQDMFVQQMKQVLMQYKDLETKKLNMKYDRKQLEELKVKVDEKIKEVEAVSKNVTEVWKEVVGILGTQKDLENREDLMQKNDKLQKYKGFLGDEFTALQDIKAQMAMVGKVSSLLHSYLPESNQSQPAFAYAVGKMKELNETVFNLPDGEKALKVYSEQKTLLEAIKGYQYSFFYIYQQLSKAIKEKPSKNKIKAYLQEYLMHFMKKMVNASKNMQNMEDVPQIFLDLHHLYVAFQKNLAERERWLGVYLLKDSIAKVLIKNAKDLETVQDLYQKYASARKENNAVEEVKLESRLNMHLSDEDLENILLSQKALEFNEMVAGMDILFEQKREYRNEKGQLIAYDSKNPYLLLCKGQKLYGLMVKKKEVSKYIVNRVVAFYFPVKSSNNIPRRGDNFISNIESGMLVELSLEEAQTLQNYLFKNVKSSADRPIDTVKDLILNKYD